MVYDQETRLGYDHPPEPVPRIGRNNWYAYKRGFDRCILTPAARREALTGRTPYQVPSLAASFRRGWDDALQQLQDGKGVAYVG